MPAKISVSSDDQSTTIVVKNILNGRIKLLFFIQALAAVTMLLFFVLILFDGSYSIPVYLFILTFIAGYSFISYRFIAGITEQEIIQVDSSRIVIQQKTLLSTKEKIFELDKIDHFAYDGFPKYTDHPMKGESFDYFGFEAGDKQIQALHGDGNISLVSEGKTYHFGKRLPSWEVEKLYHAIKGATNIEFRFDQLDEALTDEEQE